MSDDEASAEPAADSAAAAQPPNPPADDWHAALPFIPKLSVERIPPYSRLSRASSKAPSAKGSVASAASKLPKWKRQLVAQRNAIEAEHAAIISEGRERELAASERLLRLRARAQRELGRAALMEAQYRTVERNRNDRLQAKALIDNATGRDVTALCAEIPMPDDEVLRELSMQFNQAMIARFRREDRSFYRIFKTLDLDGSQRISFAELETLARGPLGLTLRQLSEERLKVRSSPLLLPSCVPSGTPPSRTSLSSFSFTLLTCPRIPPSAHPSPPLPPSTPLSLAGAVARAGPRLLRPSRRWRALSLPQARRGNSPSPSLSSTSHHLSASLPFFPTRHTLHALPYATQVKRPSPAQIAQKHLQVSYGSSSPPLPFFSPPRHLSPPHISPHLTSRPAGPAGARRVGP